MASRRDQKDQARAQREALQRQEDAAAARTRRMRLLGAVLAVAVVVVVVLVVVSSGGNDKKGLKKGSASSAIVSAVKEEFAGIPQSGSTLGKPSAPVKMDYFGDLQCPVCAAFSNGTLVQTVADQVRKGRLQITYRSLETATQDPQTFQAQQTAALAAGRQNKLWEFIELFYRQQGVEGSGYVTPDFISGIARQTPGLAFGTWDGARTQPALKAQVSADAAAASKVAASGTPTLVLKGPKATKQLSGNPTFATLSKAITAAGG